LIEEVEDELIWMLSFDVKCSHDVAREIAQIHCDNDVRLAMNRGGKNMAVIGIGETKAGDEFLVPLRAEQAGDRKVHEEITQLRRTEDIGVIESREHRHVGLLARTSRLSSHS
jgi:hypothetical protein